MATVNSLTVLMFLYVWTILDDVSLSMTLCLCPFFCIRPKDIIGLINNKEMCSAVVANDFDDDIEMFGLPIGLLVVANVQKCSAEVLFAREM